MMESDDEADYRRRDKFRSERGSGPSRYTGEGPPGGRGGWRGPPPPPMRGHGPPMRGPPPPSPYYHWGGEDMRRGPPGHNGPPPMKVSESFCLLFVLNLSRHLQLQRHRSEMMEPGPSFSHDPPPRKHERRMVTPSAAAESSSDGFMPQRMTFKAFLSTQDDFITDEEAAQKYADYKLEFRRQHLNEFFSNHKESEWFKEKYHPNDGQKRKEVIQRRIVKRLEVFNDIEKSGNLENLELNFESEGNLVKLLNSAAIRLEGGTEEDLQVLEKSEEDVVKENLKELHRTSSVFIKCLHPKITHSEIETVSKKYTGYLRTSISPPDPLKKWTRKGWITFERKAKIKEICFNLNNTKIRGKELDTVVNKDLSKRIRPVSHIFNDQRVARNDVKIAAKLITNLDTRKGLWTDTSNPLLANVHDYLIEEVSAEEEELLQKTANVENSESGDNEEKERSIEVHDEVLKVLDKLILYLRIVHSIDLYSHAQYQNEDEMPNRLGLLHVREMLKEGMKVTEAEVEKINKEREKKFMPIIEKKLDLDMDESIKLGINCMNFSHNLKLLIFRI